MDIRWERFSVASAVAGGIQIWCKDCATRDVTGMDEHLYVLKIGVGDCMYTVAHWAHNHEKEAHDA